MQHRRTRYELWTIVSRCTVPWVLCFGRSPISGFGSLIFCSLPLALCICLSLSLLVRSFSSFWLQFSARFLPLNTRLRDAGPYVSWYQELGNTILCYFWYLTLFSTHKNGGDENWAGSWGSWYGKEKGEVNRKGSVGHFTGGVGDLPIVHLLCLG